MFKTNPLLPLKSDQGEMLVIIKASLIAQVLISTKDNQFSKKKYFGIITSHTVLETNEIDAQVLKSYEQMSNTRVDKLNESFLIWDRLTIVTKRALNSYILPKRMAQMDVLMSATIELTVIKNLLQKERKSKLLDNILEANANIHQFSTDEIRDSRMIWKTLSQNAIEMVNKSNPMVFFKGINNLMVVDIANDDLRLKSLCDIAIDSIFKSSIGNFSMIKVNFNLSNRGYI